MKRRMLIKTDGTIEALAHPVSTAEICRLIGAVNVDTVNLRHLGEPLHVMVIDDAGYEVEEVDHGEKFEPRMGRLVRQFERRPLRALKPVNRLATELYLCNCKPGTTHEIVGDVVIVPDVDYE